jgi:hypothetical protein
MERLPLLLLGCLLSLQLLLWRLGTVNQLDAVLAMFHAVVHRVEEEGGSDGSKDEVAACDLRAMDGEDTCTRYFRLLHQVVGDVALAVPVGAEDMDNLRLLVNVHRPGELVGGVDTAVEGDVMKLPGCKVHSAIAKEAQVADWVESPSTASSALVATLLGLVSVLQKVRRVIVRTERSF